MKDDKQILLVTQKNAAQDDPSTSDIYQVGTISTVLQLLKLPDGTVKVLVEGGNRARIIDFTDNSDFFQARAEVIQEDTGDSNELEALARTVVSQFEKYIKLNKKIPPEVLVSINQIEDSGKLADTVASHLALKIFEKQQLLELAKISERLERVYASMESEIEVLQVEKKIRSRVKRQMEKTQREYYLNEQLKAIQKELGEAEDGRDEVSEFEERIKKTKLSKEAREKAQGEVKKLRGMSPMSARGDGGAQLPRLDAQHPLEEALPDQEGHQAGPRDPGRRPLRPAKGQGTHPRVPGRAATHQQGRWPDPLPRRPARRRQDFAGEIHRAGDRAQLHTHVARRRA